MYKEISEFRIFIFGKEYPLIAFAWSLRINSDNLSQVVKAIERILPNEPFIVTRKGKTIYEKHC